MRFSPLLSLAAIVSSVSSVFLDEAYRVDFHKALLGLPKPESTFFHQPYAESKASLLYTISEKNVLGAINPKDGAVVWRHLLTSNQTFEGSTLRRGLRPDTVFTACEEKLSAWSSGDGRLVWERELRDEPVRDFHVLSSLGGGDEAVVALTVGHNSKVQSFQRETGILKWSYEDNSGDRPVMLSVSPDKTYIVSLHSAMLKGQKIAITTLDTASGKKLDSFQLGSDSEVSGDKDILFVQSSSKAPALAWIGQGKDSIRFNILGTKPVVTMNTKAKIEHATVHGPDSQEAPSHVLVHYRTSNENWAEVYHIDAAKGKVSKSHELPRLQSSSAFSVTSSGSSVYFTRITENEVSLTSSTSDSVLERWKLQNVKVPGLLDGFLPVHAASEVVTRSGSNYAVRSAVLLDSGDWVLVRNGDSSWSRPESLAGIVSAEWAEQRVSAGLKDDLEEEANRDFVSAFVHRATRHAAALQTLPAWGQSIVLRFSQFVLSLGREEEFKNKQISDSNVFKLVIAKTDNGRIIGLDFSHSGRVLFNLRAEDSNFLKDTTAYRSVLATLPDKARSSGLYDQWLKELGVIRDDSDLELALLGPRGFKAGSSIGTRTEYRQIDGNLVGFRGDLEAWRFVPAAGEEITLVASILEDEPVASIGKVLGDRNVLYKYLNPNALELVAVNEQQKTASLFIVDGVSGDILHSAKFQRVDTSRPVAGVISENWFAFSFATSPTDDGKSKGYQLVMSEMYESDLPNDRGVLGATSNYSTVAPNTKLTKPYTVSKTFHIPEEISKMAVTQTRQGITSRQLLVSFLRLKSIVGIPGPALDARRIVGKDPTTPQMMEGLSRYQPLIEVDPTWVLNHKQEVLGVRNIMTSPALFESTGLVFAYGIDIFGTQVTPSFAFDILGSSFNKFQLILTVVALLAATFFVAPFIQRKETNTLWKNS